MKHRYTRPAKTRRWIPKWRKRSTELWKSSCFIYDRELILRPRVRAMWDKWHMFVVLRYDASIFTEADILELLKIMGDQIGIGEGRPDSKSSSGQGWGRFTVDLTEAQQKLRIGRLGWPALDTEWPLVDR